MSINDDPRRPTVILGGAAKSGTTTLYRLIGRHPQVFAPAKKEPFYFAFPEGVPTYRGPRDERFASEVVATLDDYLALFAPGMGRQHRIDGSTLYLSEPGTAERIASALPDVRIVFVLRDPVTRAFSAFNQMRRDGREPLVSFADALAAEPSRTAAGWSPSFRYAALSRYGAMLREYYAAFDASQILVVVYEDLAVDLPGVLRRVETHLGLQPHQDYPLRLRYNPSGSPRSAHLHRWLHRRTRLRQMLRNRLPEGAHRAVMAVRNANLLRPPELDANTADRLADELRSDAKETTRLTGVEIRGRWTGL